MIKVVVICEGEFHCTAQFDTEEEKYAYAKGFVEGADAYGAGSVYVVTKEEADAIGDPKVIRIATDMLLDD